MAEGEVKEALAVADDNTQAQEGSGQEAVALDSPAADDPKNEQDTDSLLDVFKNEGVEENPIMALSRGLSDVNMQSLLEQAKHVAEEIKYGRLRLL